MNKTMTLDELRSKMEAGEKFTLVETLPVEYFRHTHLPGAINLPTDKVAEIVVYCADYT